MRALIIFCALLSLSLAIPSHHSHKVNAHKKATIHKHPQVKKHEHHIQGKDVKAPCTTPQCLISSQELIRNMDASADPCEDFNRFACGSYYDSHPPVNGSEGMFYTTDDRVTERLDIILNSGPQPGETKPVTDCKTHYTTCLDTVTMDSLGLAPMYRHLLYTGQNGWPIAMNTYDETAFNLYSSITYYEQIGLNNFIAVGISTDLIDTSYNIMYIAEGSLGLSSTYLLDPDNYPDQIAAYTTFIAESAKLVRDYIGSSVTDAQIDSEANDIVDFEMELADIYTFVPQSREDVLERTDVTHLQEVTDESEAGQFDWLTYFSYLFVDTSVGIATTEPIYIYGEPFFTDFSELLANTDNRTLANYIGWRFVMETSLSTTDAMRSLTLDFENVVFGVTSLTPRDVRCRFQTQFNFGMQLSRAYMDDYFTPETKTQVSILVELMRAAFGTLLNENTWMLPADLVVAHEKLDAIISRVAYPDWIMNDTQIVFAFQGLNIVAGEQFNNLMKVGAFSNFNTLNTFRAPPTIAWFYPPTVVNAFYDPLSNSITILAGIIQYPFYIQGTLSAVNYGAIGMVIGHEMTHGFDDTGRHFDKDGNLANWWSQESIDGFNNRSQCFVDQYNGYSPPEFTGTQYEGKTVDGQATLGENIADNGGIREAFRAYAAYVLQFGEEGTLPGLPYTPKQLFFLGFANVWCERKTAEALSNQIDTDPHSPGQFRIIGPLSNDADFWNEWNCPDGSAMNRGTDRCLLW